MYELVGNRLSVHELGGCLRLSVHKLGGCLRLSVHEFGGNRRVCMNLAEIGVCA